MGRKVLSPINQKYIDIAQAISKIAVCKTNTYNDLYWDRVEIIKTKQLPLTHYNQRGRTCFAMVAHGATSDVKQNSVDNCGAFACEGSSCMVISIVNGPVSYKSNDEDSEVLWIAIPFSQGNQ